MKSTEIYEYYLNLLPTDMDNRKELALKMSLRTIKEIIESYEFDLINYAFNPNAMKSEVDDVIMKRINYWDDVETQLLRNTNSDNDSHS